MNKDENVHGYAVRRKKDREKERNREKETEKERWRKDRNMIQLRALLYNRLSFKEKNNETDLFYTK